MHDAPVKDIAWIPQMSLLVSGSYDKTLKYWDLRQSNPVHTQQLPDRCYCLCVRHPLIVVGTADRNQIVFNLQYPQVHHTFATAGFDGAFNFWDKDSKQRLKAMARCSNPMIDHLRNSMSVDLDDLVVLILDEADRLLELGFSAKIQELIRLCPKRRQTMLFLATMTNEVNELIKMSLTKPLHLAADPSAKRPARLTEEVVILR